MSHGAYKKVKLRANIWLDNNLLFWHQGCYFVLAISIEAKAQLFLIKIYEKKPLYINFRYEPMGVLGKKRFKRIQ